MIDRREFLGGVALAAAAKPGALAAAPAKSAARSFYELRSYKLRLGPQQKIVNDFLKDVAIPALGRLKVKPVGVFEVLIGPEAPTVQMVIPYDSAAAFAAVQTQLASDAEYQKGSAALAYHGATAAQPAYVRIDSSLLLAMDYMPALDVPAGLAEQQGRIFELRTYEGPSEALNEKKAAMFGAGAIDIFRRVGLTPIFYGKTVIGMRLPSFVYLLTYPNLAAREEGWEKFRRDPAWKKLKNSLGYSDPDVLSNISNVILRPTTYSGI